MGLGAGWGRGHGGGRSGGGGGGGGGAAVAAAHRAAPPVELTVHRLGGRFHSCQPFFHGAAGFFERAQPCLVLVCHACMRRVYAMHAPCMRHACAATSPPARSSFRESSASTVSASGRRCNSVRSACCSIHSSAVCSRSCSDEAAAASGPAATTAGPATDASASDPAAAATTPVGSSSRSARLCCCACSSCTPAVAERTSRSSAPCASASPSRRPSDASCDRASACSWSLRLASVSFCIVCFQL